MLFQGINWLFVFILKSAQAKQPFGQRCFFCAQPELTPVLLLTSDEGIYLFHLPVCLFCFCLSAFLSGILSKLSWSTNYTGGSLLALFQYVCLSICLSVCFNVCLGVCLSVRHEWGFVCAQLEHKLASCSQPPACAPGFNLQTADRRRPPSHPIPTIPACPTHTSIYFLHLRVDIMYEGDGKLGCAGIHSYFLDCCSSP